MNTRLCRLSVELSKSGPMKKCGCGVITVMEAPRCDPTALAPLVPGERFIRSVQLGGGLFNQLWTLLGLVFQAAERKLPFVLPTFDSHISPHSMGIRSTEANLPRSVPFAELFDVNCLVGALHTHGIAAHEQPPAHFRKTAALSLKPNELFLSYKRYVENRSRDEADPAPLEDVVYRALRPSARLLAHARAFIRASAALRSPRGYGCVHARIENDMRRWWYHVGKVKPVTMAEILRLLDSIDDVRTTPSLFVAVGSDLRRSDEELLRGERTPWNGSMVRRRSASDDRSGRLVADAGSSSPSSSTLSYVESAVVDFAICRAATWFAGWSSSSFSASLAHIRHLDRPVDRYYAYCGAMPALRRSAMITLQPPADTVRIHTCKLRNRTVKSQAGRA